MTLLLLSILDRSCLFSSGGFLSQTQKLVLGKIAARAYGASHV